MTYDSKEDYLEAFRRELESRGERALSSSAIQRALDEAEDRFDQLQGRGRTPRAVSEALGEPSERAEVVVATRLLRLRPGSPMGPELVSYLRVIRALWIAAPINLVVALAPVLAVLGLVGLAFGVCVWVAIAALMTLASFLFGGGGASLSETAAGIFHLLAFVSGSVFVGGLLTLGLEFVFYLIWRWSRWNVGFLLEEPT